MIAITDTLSRGQSGVGPFPTSNQDDLKLSYVSVADLTTRDAIPIWKRIANMTVYVMSTGLEYVLGTDLTIAGQIWIVKTYGLPANVLVHDDILTATNYIKPQLIQNIFLNSSYVVTSQAAMLALTTLTGNFLIRTDTSQVFIKLNNTNPAALGDFAIASGGPGVISVNGGTGVVSITIANLLAVAQNTTDFNTAVTANATVASHTGSISTLTTNLATTNSNVTTLNNYVLTHLGTKSISANMQSPTSGEDLYVVKWNNSSNVFTLAPEINIGGTTAIWGGISGTLSDQLDLQAQLVSKWSLNTGGTLTGVNTLTSNLANGLIFNGAWATIANASHLSISPTITNTSGNSVINGLLINPTFVTTAGSPTFYPLRVQSGGVDIFRVSSNNTITDAIAYFNLQIIAASTISWGSNGLLTFSGSDIYIDAGVAGGSTFFRTNGTTIGMKLTSTSNLLIGTSTDDTVNKLQVNGRGIFNGSFSTITNYSHLSVSPTITNTSGNSVIDGLKINPTFVTTAGSPTFYPLRVQAGGVDLFSLSTTYQATLFSGQSAFSLRIGDLLEIGRNRINMFAGGTGVPFDIYTNSNSTYLFSFSDQTLNGNFSIVDFGLNQSNLTNASSTATQIGSRTLNLKSSLWNGAAETKGWFSWRANASTTVNQAQDLTLYTSTGASPGYGSPIVSFSSTGTLFDVLTAGITATPYNISLGSSYANTAGDPSKAKLKFYQDAVANNTYGFGISTGGFEFHIAGGGNYNFYGAGVGKVTISAVDGSMVLGSLVLTNASTLLDLQSTTKALKLTNVTNIASIVTPALGMEAFDAATTLMNDYEGAGAWQTRAYVAKAQTLTNKTLTSSTNVLGGVTMTLGSDASYDMYHRGTGVLTRIANGTTGQVLTATTGAAPSWGATNTALSGITAATASNSIDNGNNGQTWNWNSLVGSTGGFIISSNSSVGVTGYNLFKVQVSGANNGASQSTTAASIINTRTGTTSTAIALYLSVGGGDNSYALLINTGWQGIGTLTPSRPLHVNFLTGINNNVEYALRISKNTGTTPAIGIGVGMEFEVQTAVTPTSKIGATIEAVTTNVTSTTEAFDLVFKTMTGGAAANEKLRILANGNLGFNGSSFGGGVLAVFLANATTVPTSNPTGGGIAYVEAGALKYRGSSGSITVLAPA